MATIKFEFKVICLTEAWCKDDSRNETLFNLENYTAINQVRKHGRGGGYPSLFNSSTFKLSSDLGTNRNDIESLAMEIINKKSKNIAISAQYRWPADGFKQYKTNFENFFNKMKNSDKAIYIYSRRHKS